MALAKRGGREEKEGKRKGAEEGGSGEEREWTKSRAMKRSSERARARKPA